MPPLFYGEFMVFFQKHSSQAEKERFSALIESVASSAEAQKMRQFIQHGSTSTYDHCESVAQLSFWLNRRLKLRAEERELIRAAFLHDFYLYDWHIPDGSHRLHGFSHPHTAAENAKRVFGISGSEAEDIESHMWPLTITKLPRRREGWIICLADKICAIREII